MFHVVAVAILALVGLLTGHYGSTLSFILMGLAGVVIQLLGRIGLSVQIGWQYGLVVLFWLNVVAFAGPAYGLYWARRRLGRGCALALSLWTALYLWFMFRSGGIRDWP